LAASRSLKPCGQSITVTVHLIRKPFQDGAG